MGVYPDGNYAYLLEIKYLKKADASEQEIQRTIDAATEQLKRYGKDTKAVKAHSGTQLIKLALVFVGSGLKSLAQV